MPEGSLPEELIHDILQYCILVHSETFLDPANNRAFFRREGAPASPLTGKQLLLVSQRWRRIGTPLMYTSLWLSKAFHTLSVVDLFKSRPSLAEHVVDFRLDGGFIPQLLDLVSLACNVRNVHISWNLDALDDTSTLRKVFLCLRPHTLYLGHQRSIEVQRQSDTLSTQINSLIAGEWSSLVRPASSPYVPCDADRSVQRYVHLAYWYQLTAGTARALQDAPSLEAICIHCEDIDNWSWSRDLLTFLDNPSLRTIYTRSTFSAEFTRKNLLEHGVRKVIVDRLTFVRHAIEWGEL